MKVSVCVTTYRRPEGLDRLLESLAALDCSSLSPELEVIVVDNDVEGSARPVYDAWRDRFTLHYDIEPTRGIPFGRNRCVSQVAGDSSFVAFVDDDETVTPKWLCSLLEAQRQYAADIVTGPVEPRYAVNPPAWIVRGGFFERSHRPDGTPLDVAFTSNVLVRTEILCNLPQPFDVRFGLNGGDDAHLFRRLARAGCRIVWAEDAVVYETIPPSRMTASWLVQRAFRTANAMAFTEVELAPAKWFAVSRVIAKGVVWIGRGLVSLPAAVVAGRHAVVKRLRWIAYGTGLWLGLTGMKYQEYRRVHGE
jgi:glycosyltransferase involved in cell wall biosynthesis